MGHQLSEDGAASQHAAFCRAAFGATILAENTGAGKISSRLELAPISMAVNRLHRFAHAMTGQ
jgi:hypothetical protein